MVAAILLAAIVPVAEAGHAAAHFDLTTANHPDEFGVTNLLMTNAAAGEPRAAPTFFGGTARTFIARHDAIADVAFVTTPFHVNLTISGVVASPTVDVGSWAPGGPFTRRGSVAISDSIGDPSPADGTYYGTAAFTFTVPANHYLAFRVGPAPSTSWTLDTALSNLSFAEPSPAYPTPEPSAALLFLAAAGAFAVWTLQPTRRPRS